GGRAVNPNQHDFFTCHDLFTATVWVVLYLIVLHPRPDVHHFTKGKPHSLPRGGIRSSRRVPTGPTAGHVHARGARGSEVRRQQKNRPEGRFLAGDVLVDHPDVG